MNSACSTGSKYDLDILRSEVGHCKSRVQKLKRELAKMDAEVCIKQKVRKICSNCPHLVIFNFTKKVNTKIYFIFRQNVYHLVRNHALKK